MKPIKQIAHIVAKLPQAPKPVKAVSKPKVVKPSVVTEIHAYKLVLISEIGWYSELNAKLEAIIDLTPGSFDGLSQRDQARVAKIVMRQQLIELLKGELKLVADDVRKAAKAK